MAAQNITCPDLLNSLQIGVFRCSAAAKPKFLFVNSFFCRLIGSTNRYLVDTEVLDYFEESKELKSLLSNVRQSSLAITRHEMTLKKKKGKSIHVALSFTPVLNQKKKVEFVDVVVEDITAQKQYQNSLSESKELFHIIFENSAIAISVVGEDGCIIAWNPSFEKMIQLSPEELFNKPFADLLTPEEWKKLCQQEKRKKGMVRDFVTEISVKKKRIDVNLSASPMLNVHQKVVGSIIIIQDISKQKKTQDMLVQAKIDAEEANNAKSLFLAKMSHEVRTPMNAVIGMLDITLDGNLSADQRDNLKVAKDAADNLLALLNDILDLSKAESDKITLEMIEVGVHDMVVSVCKGLVILAQKKNIELKWVIAKDVPRYVMTDPVRIRQILINLVNNAIKFTHEGEVRVVVKVDNFSKNQCKLLFSVQDTGIGIPAERQEAVFDVFSQADETTTRKYGGTGLGLAICRKLSKLMGGDIWIESEVGKGSHFNFTIQCDVIKKSVKANGKGLSGVAEAKAGIIEEELGHSLRILLAEDNLVNQRIAVKILEKRGWDVVTADNGEEVLSALDKQAFDLILMDDHMPELSGIEATLRIRQQEKQTGQHVPIIAMTANAMSGDREKYLEAGMDGYVSKPINRDALYGEIVNLMSKKG